jgi:hypothetical protein
MCGAECRGNHGGCITLAVDSIIKKHKLYYSVPFFFCKRSAKVKVKVKLKVKLKVKQSFYRPEQALSVSGVSGSLISRQSVHTGGQIVSHTHRPLLSH